MTDQSQAWRVVVGVADSDSARAALRAAGAEAAQRDLPLLLLRVWRDTGWEPSMTRADMAHLPDWERADRDLLDAAAASVRSSSPEVSLMTEWRAGDLYTALEEAADGCVLFVLGTGHDDPSTVADWLRQRVDCPVLAVDAATAAGATADRSPTGH